MRKQYKNDYGYGAKRWKHRKKDTSVIIILLIKAVNKSEKG